MSPARRNGSLGAVEAAQAPPRRLTPGAFAVEYESAFPTLWCIAAGVLHDRSAADDVVQEAAMAALQQLDRFEPGTSFVAWMGRFVRFVALNAARRRARRATAPADPRTLDESIEGDFGGDRPILTQNGELRSEQESFDDHVMRALGSLDATARTCLLLRTVLDLPYREIARALDIPEGTAMSHVHRARLALRERLTPPPDTTCSSSAGGPSRA